MRERMSACCPWNSGPPPRTWSTPIADPPHAVFVEVAATPRQIFGVPLPSAGIPAKVGRVCADADERGGDCGRCPWLEAASSRHSRRHGPQSSAWTSHILHLDVALPGGNHSTHSSD